MEEAISTVFCKYSSLRKEIPLLKVQQSLLLSRISELQKENTHLREHKFVYSSGDRTNQNRPYDEFALCQKQFSSKCREYLRRRLTELGISASVVIRDSDSNTIDKSLCRKSEKRDYLHSTTNSFPSNTVDTNYRAHLSPITRVNILKNRNVLASCDCSGTIKFWNMQKIVSGVSRRMHFLKSIQGHCGPILSSCVIKSCSMVVTGGCDSSIKLWNIHNVGTNTNTTSDLSSIVLSDHTGPVNALKYITSPADKDILVSASSSDKSIRLWDLGAEKSATCTARPVALKKYEEKRGPMSIAWDKGFGKQLIVGFETGEICALDIEKNTRKVLYRINDGNQCGYPVKNTLTTASSSPFVLVTSPNGVINCIDLRARKICLHAKINHGGITAIDSCNCNSYQYAFGDRLGGVGIWDLRKRDIQCGLMCTEEEEPMSAQEYTADKAIYSISHHDKYRIFAVGSGNKKISVFKY